MQVLLCFAGNLFPATRLTGERGYFLNLQLFEKEIAVCGGGGLHALPGQAVGACPALAVVGDDLED
jgi:hypothetical protein